MKEKKLDNFEKSLIKQLEGEHKRRSGKSIKECDLKGCWFKKIKQLIEDN